MRILFTTQPAVGHLHPLVPLAQALGAAGHEVAFACSPSFRPMVEACGLLAFSAGLDWRGMSIPKAFPEYMNIPKERRTQWVAEHVFTGVTAREMVTSLLTLSHSWKPDVMVRDTAEYGACVAAEIMGLPHVSVEVGAFRPGYWRHDAVSQQLNALRRAYGLPSDPDLVMLHRYLHLSFVPPRYQDPGAPLPPTAHALRPICFDRSGNETLPTWVPTLPRYPTVYATLGTVVNRRPRIFRTIIEAFREVMMNLILTVGRNQDPAQFGSPPPTVHIQRYIPQSLLLPYCDLVITHGGWNTVLVALCHGLPLVVIPVTADQPDNAQRCTTLGIGQVIQLTELTPELLRDVVHDVLQDPRYRRNAMQLREEVKALPGIEYAVALVEKLALEKTPQVVLDRIDPDRVGGLD